MVNSGIWTARVRDSNLALGDPVEISRLTLVENFNAADSLALDGDLSRIQPALVVGSGIIVYDSTGAQRFSGDLQHPERHGDKTGAAIYRSDSGLLYDYILWPVPTAAFTKAGQTSAYDTITGVAETRLLHYISVNMGSTAYNSGSDDRRVPHLRLPTSLGRGPSGTNYGRFNELGPTVMGLAEQAGLRLQIVQTFTGLTPYLDVTLTVAPDMSAYIRFGTAEASGPALLGEGSRYSVDRPTATVVLVAAGGQGSNRLLSSLRDIDREALWHRRVEKYVDQRDVGSQFDALATVNETTKVETAATKAKAVALTNKDHATLIRDQAAAYLVDFPASSGATARRDAAQTALDTATTNYTDATTALTTATADRVAAQTAYTAAVTADTASITDSLTSAMLDGDGATEVAIEVASTPDFVIGSSDCPLGAKVTAVIDTLVLVNRIRQITTVLSADSSGPTEDITAIFGTPDAPLTVTQRQIASSIRRLNVIERAP